MNRFGLPEGVLIEIVDALRCYAEIGGAKIFGSRAKGNFKRYSDIDIAIYAESDNSLAANLKEDLEDLDIIYRFDVVHYEKIANQDLKEHIDRVGIDII